MAKGKGFDPVADANELAQHNINPYYWINKVTSFTLARWMAQKRLAIIVLPFYVVAWVIFIWSFSGTAAAKNVSIWRLIFDFSNSQSLALLASMLMVAFYTVVVVIMVIQLLFARRPKSTAEEKLPNKEKKQPKRRKDYH